jgi:MFS family permease
VGAVFFMAWSAISLPASMGVIVKALPAGKQVMGVSMHSLVSRVPKALGPLLGGVLVTLFGEQEGIRIAFMVAIGLVVVAIVIQQTLLSSSLDAATVERPERNPWRLWQRFDRPLRHLLLADILLRFCEQIPNAFVILWCMQVIAAPIDAWQFGVLTTVEMVTSALIYIPVARFADQGNKKTFVLVTFVFFTLFPFVLLVSQTFSLLLVAFVVRGLKEFGEPTRKAMILSLAPEGHKAGAFGLYYLMRDTVVSLAAFGGAVLWQIDPALNLWVAGGFGCMATLWFAWRGKDVTPALPRPGMKA